MQITPRHRTIALIVAGGIALFLIAASLSNLEFDPGYRIRSDEQAQEQAPAPGGAPANPEALLLGFRIAVITLLVILGITVVIAIIVPSLRPHLIRGIVLAAIFVAIFAWWSPEAEEGEQEEEQESAAMDRSMPEDFGEGGETVDPEEAINNEIPMGWVYFGSVVVVGLLAGLGFMLYRRAMGAEDETAEQEVAQEAQQTLEALDQGQDFANTIIRCYAQMSDIVRKRDGIQRDRSLTPREFESRLVRFGFHREAVATLTRLFEQVRYGHKELDTEHERQAMRSLSLIADTPNPKRGGGTNRA
jgi:hypothetical protein